MSRPNTDPTNPYRAGQTNTNGTIICGAKNRNGQTVTAITQALATA